MSKYLDLKPEAFSIDYFVALKANEKPTGFNETGSGQEQGQDSSSSSQMESASSSSEQLPSSSSSGGRRLQETPVPESSSSSSEVQTGSSSSVEQSASSSSQMETSSSGAASSSSQPNVTEPSSNVTEGESTESVDNLVILMHLQNMDISSLQGDQESQGIWFGIGFGEEMVNNDFIGCFLDYTGDNNTDTVKCQEGIIDESNKLTPFEEEKWLDTFIISLIYDDTTMTAEVEVQVLRPFKLKPEIMEAQNAYELMAGDHMITWAFGIFQNEEYTLLTEEDKGTNSINLAYADELVHLASDLGICIVSRDKQEEL